MHSYSKCCGENFIKIVEFQLQHTNSSQLPAILVRKWQKILAPYLCEHMCEEDIEREINVGARRQNVTCATLDTIMHTLFQSRLK